MELIIFMFEQGYGPEGVYLVNGVDLYNTGRVWWTDQNVLSEDANGKRKFGSFFCFNRSFHQIECTNYLVWLGLLIILHFYWRMQFVQERYHVHPVRSV